MARLSYSTALLLAACYFTSIAWAGHDCDGCGCHQKLRKVCRLECSTKEVTEIEYGCACEDFCVPGKSTPCGKTCEHDCDGSHCRTIWQPRCAEVRTKHVLTRKEVKKTVPTYKWVVEYVCDDCACQSCFRSPESCTMPAAQASSVAKKRSPVWQVLFQQEAK